MQDKKGDSLVATWRATQSFKILYFSENPWCACACDRKRKTEYPEMSKQVNGNFLSFQTTNTSEAKRNRMSTITISFWETKKIFSAIYLLNSIFYTLRDMTISNAWHTTFLLVLVHPFKQPLTTGLLINSRRTPNPSSAASHVPILSNELIINEMLFHTVTGQYCHSKLDCKHVAFCQKHYREWSYFLYLGHMGFTDAQPL